MRDEQDIWPFFAIRQQIHWVPGLSRYLALRMSGIQSDIQPDVFPESGPRIISL